MIVTEFLHYIFMIGSADKFPRDEQDGYDKSEDEFKRINANVQKKRGGVKAG